MPRTGIIYCQKKVAAALEQEFGFAPARLKEIVLLEADDFCFYIQFRIGARYYTYRDGKIDRIVSDDWILANYRFPSSALDLP
jgi:hypothetical protein